MFPAHCLCIYYDLICDQTNHQKNKDYNTGSKNSLQFFLLIPGSLPGFFNPILSFFLFAHICSHLSLTSSADSACLKHCKPSQKLSGLRG